MEEIEWILCPVCKSKTRLKIRKDTVLKNFPHMNPKNKSGFNIVEDPSFSSEDVVPAKRIGNKGQAD